MLDDGCSYLTGKIKVKLDGDTEWNKIKWQKLQRLCFENQ